MRFEPIFVGGNVIRFPVELRAKPSIALLLDLAPDRSEVALIAEAFGVDEPDPEARDNADRAMAETIALTIFPIDPDERRKALIGLLQPMMARAGGACAKARQAALLADEAGARLAGAQASGGYWTAALEAAQETCAVEAARLQIEAHDAAHLRRQPGGRSRAPR